MNWYELPPLLFALLYFSSIVATYLLVCGLSYRLPRRLAEKTARRRLQQREPSHADVRRERFWSLVSIGIFTLVATTMWAASQAGLTRVYFDIDEHGWAWLLASAGILVLLHDAWFYWLHYLMHRYRPLYRIHRLHHRSVTPTPYAVYAFSPLEALLQIGILPLACFTLPVHPLAIEIHLAVQFIYNLNGHLGYDLLPRSMHRPAFTLWHNTPLHHDMHHERAQGNYGLYLNVWDRLLGTNLPDYDSRLLQLRENTKESGYGVPQPD